MSDAAHPGLFEDGKAPEAFRTIGEVARALNIRQHVLRYWEEQFPMLRPVKRSGARRYYRPEDVRLIETIHRLVHREGYTLRGARQAIEAGSRETPAAGPTPPPEQRGTEARPGSELPILELRKIRNLLADALRAA
jgi:DNA-binding transcriptional MerR regulator